jgi:hypothetical protein
MAAESVCVAFGPAFGMRAQIATSSSQPFLPQGLASCDPLTFKVAICDLEPRNEDHWIKDPPMTNQTTVDPPPTNGAIVCAGFGAAFALMLQIAASKLADDETT